MRIPCLFLLLMLASVCPAALTNLAPSGTASSSSIAYGAIEADAIDGNRNGAFGVGSVFHTNNETGPSWWQVVLPSSKFIDHIRIFNRTDAIQGAVSNFRIIAKKAGVTVFDQTFLTTTATDSNNCRAWGTSAIRGIQADTIRIERISNTAPAVNFLTFAEFEVWGSSTALPALLTPVSVTGSAAGFSTALTDVTDGDIHGNYNSPGSPIYHSAVQGVGQYVEMDLGNDMLVQSLLLFNRSEANGTQLVRVKVLDSAGATSWTQDVNIGLGTATPFNYGFELLPNIGGRKVRIETVNNEFLMLAEVQAFGNPLTALPPVVENVAASAITGSTAQVGANLQSTGFAPVTLKVYYGPTDGGSTPASWASVTNLGVQTVAGNYPFTLTGLTPNTTYYFRAYGENSAGNDWANASASFSTPAVTLPTLELKSAMGMTNATALVNGRVISTGQDAPVVTLFWGPNDGGTTAGNWASSVSLGNQSGAFGQLLTNLQPSTTYWFRARAVNGAGTAWSAPLDPWLTDARSPIVINEIFYEPADNTKDIEFIELWNPSASALDISGWRLDDAVQFQFPAATIIPANGYRVIASNSTAFQAYYGFAPHGQWVGKLKNSGATITLRDAAFQLEDSVDYAAGFPWPTTGAGAGPSIELINPGLENDVGGSWRNCSASPKPQTPNAPNSAVAVLAPPNVRGVNHTPTTPTANQPVVVTATVNDANVVASVSLLYQAVNPGSYIRKTDAAYASTWTTLAMNDAGIDGDAVAADGIYSATVPASVQTHRRLVRYRIQAQDSLGGSITVPYADDEQPNFAYFVYNGVPAWSGAMEPGIGGSRGVVQTFPPAVLNTIPPWHLIANETDVTNCQYTGGFDGTRFLGTIVYDGKIYDHIQFKNRGIGSTYVSGKNKWAFYFNRARNLQARDNWGRLYDQSWNSMSMDACASPWCAVHRGMSGVEEVMSYRIYELCGVPSLRTNYIHWRVIDNAAESGATQYDGDFWGLYTGMEPYEGNFLDERKLPDGNIFSIEGYGADKKHQSASQVADNTDWTAFASGTTQAGQTEAWYRTNMDVPAFCTFQALNRFIANIDIRGGDNYRAYHRPAAPLGDNRFVMMPYDMDMMCLPAHHWGAAIDGSTYGGVTNQFHAVTRHAAIAIEFRNRCRELLDLLGSDNSPNGGQMAQLIDEYAQMVNPTGAALTWADADAAMWNMHPRTQGTYGATNGYTNHKNNFFRASFADFRGAPIGSVTNWTRVLPDTDGNGYGEFEGLMGYLNDFHTNTYTGGTWTRSNGNPKGYGYKYMEWESLYGGLGLNPTTPDLSFPNRPTISYTGPVGYPVNSLNFQSSAFSPSASGGSTFRAIQWRIGEIAAPGLAGYIIGEPRKYEVEEVWTSEALTAFNASARIPLAAAKPGHTYRARVRHQDLNGRWSRWSEPVQFVAGTPDVTLYQQSLVVSEVNYHPAPTTQTERNLGFLDAEAFEWIEVKNVSNLPIDVTGVRFTKGVDCGFPDGWTIPAGGFALMVKDPAAFRQRWGTSHESILAGTFTADSLKNSGEEIKLSYGAGTQILSFTYADAAPWPTTADGNGPTLVLNLPNTLPDHSLAENWRPSVQTGGSPGADDGYTFALWAAEHPGASDPNADDDKDGLSNRLEYAFNQDPTVSSPNVITGSTQEINVLGQTDRYLTVTFNRRTDVLDVTYTPQVSSNLTSWSPATELVSAVANPDATVTETWRSATPVEDATRLFVRVQVE